ncbi:DNA repair protein RAD4 [Meyerozyma sp. JA9]|nr:DNA repair protein RAD4 [Meyerozyma sp. JA9]
MEDKNYSLLLREAAQSMGSSDNSRKRRKRNHPSETPEPTPEPIIVDTDSSHNTPNPHPIEPVGDSDSDSNLDSDEFEDVELGNVLPDLSEPAAPKDDSITITINNPKKAAPKKVVVSRDERRTRRLIHQWYIVASMCHGAIRNRWCNDYVLQEAMRKTVPGSIVALLDQSDADALTMVKSRRFLDGIRNLMLHYSRKFTVTRRGLIRKNWGELAMVQKKFERNMTFDKFQRSVLAHNGSRDLGAQGFVCLLRSLGLRARLVFSLQPPDYTSLAVEKAPEPMEKQPEPANNTEETHSTKAKFLLAQRQQPTFVETTSDPVDQSSYPIFWIEVWNKYSKKWVSIDPIILKTVEVAPMRRRTSFEPPSSDSRNQMTYVIAYDQLGGVKDVTRRYSYQFNAKTSRKRIQARSNEEVTWYNRVIRQASSPIRRDKVTSVDAYELKEFHDRDKAEGMPNSLADFKNHPLFALKTQLRSNEVIYPDDATSKVGTFRSRTKKNSTVMTVYKRAHVYQLRSARGWYMRGRVLKVGAQALKVKTKKNTDDDDDEDGRLYAEFQTSLYVPPPIEDGKVPKNAYGNIDVYVPTMLPENGFLLKADKAIPLKLLEMTARILQIDYAKAVVKFDFGKGSKATAKEGGIVIDVQYREAVELVLGHLLDEEREKSEQMVEMIALRNWKHFLTRLRISERLIREHGRVREVREEPEEPEEAEIGKTGGFEPEAGGFGPEAGGFEPEAGGFEPEAGGFALEAGGFEPEEGGFDPDDSSNEAGGFDGGFTLDPPVQNYINVKDESSDDSEAFKPTSAKPELDHIGPKPQKKMKEEIMNSIAVPTSSDESDINLSDVSENNIFGPKSTAQRPVAKKSRLVARPPPRLKKATRSPQLKSDSEDAISEIPASFFHKDSSGRLVYNPQIDESHLKPQDEMPDSGAQSNSASSKGKVPALYTGSTLPQAVLSSLSSKGSVDDEYGFEFESE